MKIYRIFIKRFIDLLFALTGIIILSPLLVILIILLSYYNQGKPFFYQERTGKNARIFTIVKLKTMNDKKDSNGNLLPDEKRITPVGNLCRKLSLDELPQLFNILKGEMSLIGPRPLLPKYVPRYNSEQIKRLNVVPGITGWAQVNGRNTISWDQKFKYDVFYVKNQSFTLDVKIFFMTISNVLNRKDINTENGGAMPEFMGSNEVL
ncbi:sugar transferase [Winogradskyella poriferorum]|uniref:sugar transferase n=1 Tax=Winogradskyella poriferorum TaxID=307627 RepID=UPI003D64BCF6